jgi:hypothetical protein
MVLAEPVSADCAVLEQRLVAVDGWGAGGTACTEVTDDEPALTTVRGRVTTPGLSEGRIEQHMTAGRLRVDGEPVTDRDAPAPAGTHTSTAAATQSGPVPKTRQTRPLNQSSASAPPAADTSDASTRRAVVGRSGRTRTPTSRRVSAATVRQTAGGTSRCAYQR